MDCIHCGQNVYTHGSACRIPPAIISRTMAPCHDCAAKYAEIAKLRAERAIHLASIAEHSQQLAAARAALDGDREACDAWRKAWKRYDETRTVPAYSLLEDAADNHDARRAAEAKASRGGEGKP